ncbi:MAG TPA: twin-arginine translocation signal domain-containing protein [Planctomycetes bacterium]|nr:twin-arginine translocation signal domain-containing protein [Planctomycetota bacterium]
MNALNSNVSSGPKYRRDFLKVAAAGACLATIRSKSGRSSRVDLVK